jgi:hypothetical protein
MTDRRRRSKKAGVTDRRRRGDQSLGSRPPSNAESSAMEGAQGMSALGGCFGLLIGLTVAGLVIRAIDNIKPTRWPTMKDLVWDAPWKGSAR